MQVRLIATTNPVPDVFELEHTGGGVKPFSMEELIVYCARVSNPNNQQNFETADRLIAFLIRKKHWSPFEQASFTVEVKTSRAIAAQILRHWSLRFQEFSMRYSTATEIEPIELRKKGSNNRQGSLEVFDPILEVETSDGGIETIEASKLIERYMSNLLLLYDQLLEVEVAPECARFILPLATTTTLYINGRVRDWIFYLAQRCDEHAQKEHRLLAEEIRKIFRNLFPNISKALDDNDLWPWIKEQAEDGRTESAGGAETDS